MAIRTYKVTLDSKNAIAPEPVYLRQGDKTGAVVIDATLMDNGVPVSLDGLTPMFKANTADGQAVIADSTGFNVVNASGGEFTYQVPNALAAVPGKITTAYFSFSDSSGSESTFDVAFIIKKAVDITKPQADDYITIIDGTLQSLQQKIDAMNTDIQTILNAYNQGDFYNKSETDNKDAATLASAKSYSDAGDASTLASTKAYADTQDDKTLVNAKAYADKAGYVAPQTMSTISGVGVVQSPDSPLIFWRQGHTVFIGGSNAAFPSSRGNVDFWNIPNGFRPAHDQYANLLAGDTVFHVMVIKFASNGTASIQYNDNNANNYSFCGVSWFTNDQMPS
jgi:hypothetical protein